MEIKRGNEIRSQHIEHQYIAGIAGEDGRGIAGEWYGYSPAYGRLV